jgi:hypothetical protein
MRDPYACGEDRKRKDRKIENEKRRERMKL